MTNKLSTANRSPWSTFCILLVSVFITLEAAALVTPALPYISSHFGIAVSNAGIISVSYYITAIALAPLFGRLGDQKGRKKIIASGLAIFAAAEFIAALSPNIYVFLFARLLQGVGYACIFSNVFAYIPELFEENKRGKAIGLFMLFTYIATGSAGIIAGLLINNIGWYAIFIFSGTFALIGFVLISLFIPNISVKKKAEIDSLGIVLFLITITSIISMPLIISNFGATSMVTAGVLSLAIVMLLVLINVERKVKAPIIDFSVLKIKNISISAALITAQNITMVSIISALTFYAAARTGWTAVEVGLISTVNYSIAALISPLVGALLDKYKAAYLVVFALISSMVGVVIFTFTQMDSPLLQILSIAFFIGICSGCLNASLMKIIITEAPASKKGVGTGTFGMFKDLGIPLGSTFGLTLYGAAQSTKLDSNLQELLTEKGLTGADASLASAEISSGAISDKINALLLQSNIAPEAILAQAKMLSTTGAIQTVGIVNITILAIILILSLLLFKKSKQPKAELTLEEIENPE